MDLRLPDVAAEFAVAAHRAFENHLGGVDIARAAEGDPSVRRTEVAPVLDKLGVPDLTAGADLDAGLAAGELCREAGRVVLPYPLVGVLLADDRDRRPAVLVTPSIPRADHGDIFRVWRVADIRGRTWTGQADGSPLGTKLGPFVTDLTLSPDDAGEVDGPLALTLGAWQVLGSVERALELATEHVRERHQFGKPLAAFQAVQFQVADATVAVHSLRELCRFTMWRLHVAPDDRLVDALALRVHALECAQVVLRTAHQLHGAIGFCDEHDLSILTRHTQPLLRLPAGLEASTEHLVRAVEAAGFASPFAQVGSR
jgi:hypothetical protein